MLPGWPQLLRLWRSRGDDECKHFPLIANGPHLPLATAAALYIFCKLIIPDIVKKRGKKFDTRPLEIVFHGFFFGVFGIAICIGLFVFRGFLLFLGCSPIHLPLILVPLRSYFAIIGIIVIHVYSLHFIFVALNGRRLNEVHLAYHTCSLIFATYGANVQPNENVCFYVLLELSFLAVYSMLQVMNSASIEVKENLAGVRTQVYLNYLSMRQYQFILLTVHAILHLCTDCTMKKELAFIQLFVVIVFKQLYRRELTNKLELSYCNDSLLRTQMKENELKGEKLN